MPVSYPVFRLSFLGRPSILAVFGDGPDATTIPATSKDLIGRDWLILHEIACNEKVSLAQINTKYFNGVTGIDQALARIRNVRVTHDREYRLNEILIEWKDECADDKFMKLDPNRYSVDVKDFSRLCAASNAAEVAAILEASLSILEMYKGEFLEGIDVKVNADLCTHIRKKHKNCFTRAKETVVDYIRRQSSTADILLADKSSASTRVQLIQTLASADPVTPGDIVDLRRAIVRAAPPVEPKSWIRCRRPDPFIGREDDLRRIKTALGILPGQTQPKSKILSVHGQAGVGKSTLAAYLTSDPDILTAFPDAVLWSAFGLFDTANSNDEFELRNRLMPLGKRLNIPGFHSSLSSFEMSDAIGQALQGKRALLICDDIWNIQHASPILRLAEGEVRILFTTRFSSIARAVVTPTGLDDCVIPLSAFKPEDAMTLFELIAPGVVRERREEVAELLHDLRYLPLAVNVSARLLQARMDANLGVAGVIRELRREAELILQQPLPAEMLELIRETQSMLVILWLKRSIERLDADIRTCFAMLCHFKPSPATFGRHVLRHLWEDYDVDRVILTLVDSGVIQATTDGRYQIHALFRSLACIMRRETP